MENVDALFFARIIVSLIYVLLGGFLIYRANYSMLRQIYFLEKIKCDEKMIAILLCISVIPFINLAILLALSLIYLYTYSVQKAKKIYEENID